MSELRSIVASIIGFTKGRAAKIVFYKRNERWSCYIFELQCDNSIDTEIKQSLENIKKYDPKAIVVDSVDFIKPDSDGFVWIDEVVNNILFLYSKGQSNISEFLDYYAYKEEQEQKLLIFNKEQFQQSELGFMLNACIIDLWYARKKVLLCDMKYSYYMQCFDAYMMAVKAILMVLNKCYKVKYTIRINDKECSIVSQDGSDFLFKFEIEENGAYLIEKKV